MKIRDAKQLYTTQLNALRDKKQSLTNLLKEQEKSGQAIPSVDRLELTRELSEVDADYQAVQSVMEGILTKESLIHDTEAAKQQAEAAAKWGEEISKIMEIVRRISSGAKVPPQDEKKLMDYSFELYMAAKTAALAAQENDKEYDSLWDEEEDSGETQDAHEIAENAEISVPSPEVAAGASPAAEAASP